MVLPAQRFISYKAMTFPGLLILFENKVHQVDQSEQLRSLTLALHIKSSSKGRPTCCVRGCCVRNQLVCFLNIGCACTLSKT